MRALSRPQIPNQSSQGSAPTPCPHHHKANMAAKKAPIRVLVVYSMLQERHATGFPVSMYISVITVAHLPMVQGVKSVAQVLSINNDNLVPILH